MSSKSAETKPSFYRFSTLRPPSRTITLLFISFHLKYLLIIRALKYYYAKFSTHKSVVAAIFRSVAVFALAGAMWCWRMCSDWRRKDVGTERWRVKVEPQGNITNEWRKKKKKTRPMSYVF